MCPYKKPNYPSIYRLVAFLRRQSGENIAVISQPGLVYVNNNNNNNNKLRHLSAKIEDKLQRTASPINEENSSSEMKIFNGGAAIVPLKV